MKAPVFKIFCIMASLLMFGCTRSPEYIGEGGSEKIGGFTVNWSYDASGAEKAVARDILSNMIYVEGDIFFMGATGEQVPYARSNEYPQMLVAVSDFYMCRFEVSNEQFKTLIPYSLDDFSGDYDNLNLFLIRLNEVCGLHFDFPTEAQWEFAARGGRQSKGYIYPGSDDLEEVRSLSKAEGSRVPNELGFYNMADLRAEMCKDYFEEYEQSTAILEDRLIISGSGRVVRGGCYKCDGKNADYLKSKFKDAPYGYFEVDKNSYDSNIDERYCRVSARSSRASLFNYDLVGLRPVINMAR